MKYILIILIFFSYNKLLSQGTKVGIKTATPRETLDVAGSMYTKKLYLRKPAQPQVSGGAYLAGNENSANIGTYNANSSLFYYLPITFTNVPKTGLEDYDTKISISEYVLVLHNYSITNKTGNTSVVLDNTSSNTRQGSPEFLVYRDYNTKTWHIKGRFTKSIFVDLSTPSNTSFNINMYLMAYRSIITKQDITDKTVNINSTDGSNRQYSIPLPSGF
ncbi:hypothetical protein [Chryseobacterium oryctis]|uniref:Uncharacterized protein n=1 Tax=Chryseobacterium oryctis TaxID=2952618 RepID=A0ABT3HKC9_9FLAO|nr:hypothetical protein [Chryseobacterium oryctis]MCW3160219.1 hypothetical protein [Chryseobacterium oryctis]